MRVRAVVGLVAELARRDAVAREERAEVRRREAPADVELAELAVLRGHLVEAHLVDDVLDVGRVVTEQGDAPFVVVEADRGGDDLLDFPGVLPTGVAVGGHQVAALVEREVVPVVLLAAALRHRVEGHVGVLGDVGLEFALDVAQQAGVDVLLVTLEVVVRDVAGHLGDGDVGGRLFGEGRERGPLELPFGAGDVVQRRSEVDDHEVRLVAEDGEDGGRARLGVLDRLVGVEVRDALLDCAAALVFGRVTPRVPVDGSEVVQREPALVGLWGLYHTVA